MRKQEIHLRRVLLRVIVILTGTGLIAGGLALLFTDRYGDSIDQAARAIAINAVGTKITRTLSEGIYNEELEGQLLEIERNEAGEIQYLEANSRLINKLVLAFATKMEEDYSLGDTMVIPVNFGVLTGSKILSQLPYTADIRVMPLSLTKFQAETEFVSEGINQTRYKVYCTVTSEIQILAPFSRNNAQINRKVLLSEAIIVVRVPDIYVMVPEEDILDVTGE